MFRNEGHPLKIKYFHQVGINTKVISWFRTGFVIFDSCCESVNKIAVND